MPTLDEHLEAAKRSPGPPLRPVPQSDPTDTECKILCSIQFLGALYEGKGEIGRLTAFASRLRYEISKIEEAVSRA